jgi:hypothetical protein
MQFSPISQSQNKRNVPSTFLHNLAYSPHRVPLSGASLEVSACCPNASSIYHVQVAPGTSMANAANNLYIHDRCLCSQISYKVPSVMICVKICTIINRSCIAPIPQAEIPGLRAPSFSRTYGKPHRYHGRTNPEGPKKALVLGDLRPSRLHYDDRFPFPSKFPVP